MLYTFQKHWKEDEERHYVCFNLCLILTVNCTTDPCIEKEHAAHEERRDQLASEAFGDSPTPKLETAVYRVSG